MILVCRNVASSLSAPAAPLRPTTPVDVPAAPAPPPGPTGLFLRPATAAARSLAHSASDRRVRTFEPATAPGIGPESANSSTSSRGCGGWCPVTPLPPPSSSSSRDVSFVTCSRSARLDSSYRIRWPKSACHFFFNYFTSESQESRSIVKGKMHTLISCNSLSFSSGRNPSGITTSFGFRDRMGLRLDTGGFRRSFRAMACVVCS
ncbi:hypothetical protein BC828DRAFT_182445 [Blastocladiella britannica]|nr:hypothetical protein BC828DRAFT_182445 [Blastocladiella britannica]